MTIHIEVTDLFCGEANYSWVRRLRYTPDRELTDRALIRRVKKMIGWDGMRCRTTHYGDMIRIDATPSGLLNVCFITFGE